jgi:hypothetical protein
MPLMFREEESRQDVTIEDLLVARALHVDDWRLAGHRDRFASWPTARDATVAKSSRQLDAFALDGAEPANPNVTA